MENLVIMDLNKVFNKKNVFVTGHTGFKGSWLVAWLKLLGANVKGYSLSPENKNDLHFLLGGNDSCESVIADVCDVERLKRELLIFKPDFVFHLAAQPLVRLSYEMPLQTFEVNCMGSGYLLDALRLLDNPCNVVMITTDKVYLNIEMHYAYKENDKLGGYDPYSASKAAAEILIESYKKSFFNPAHYNQHFKSIAVARAGNVIGGGDWAKDRIIPDIVKAISNDRPIQVRNPNSVRPWQHVLEPLSGYLQLAAHQAKDPVKYAETYNFGPTLTDNLTVGELVNYAIIEFGKGQVEYIDEKNALHEATLLQLDIKKAAEQLNWYPKLTAKEAINSTVTWYKTFLTYPTEIKRFTQQQIVNFGANSVTL